MTQTPEKKMPPNTPQPEGYYPPDEGDKFLHPDGSIWNLPIKCLCGGTAFIITSNSMYNTTGTCGTCGATETIRDG